METCGALNDWSAAGTVIETDTDTQLIVRDSVSTTTSSRRFIRLRVQTGPWRFTSLEMAVRNFGRGHFRMRGQLSTSFFASECERQDGGRLIVISYLQAPSRLTTISTCQTQQPQAAITSARPIAPAFVSFR